MLQLLSLLLILAAQFSPGSMTADLYDWKLLIFPCFFMTLNNESTYSCRGLEQHVAIYWFQRRVYWCAKCTEYCNSSLIYCMKCLPAYLPNARPPAVVRQCTFMCFGKVVTLAGFTNVAYPSFNLPPINLLNRISLCSFASYPFIYSSLSSECMQLN